MAHEIKSPDNQHTLQLKFAGSVHQGSADWYSVKLDGKKIDGLDVGEGVWSPDSRYIAFQEWCSKDYSSGPKTRLKVIDVQTMTVAHGPVVEAGFAEKFKFSADAVAYTATYKGEDRTQELAMTLSSAEWAPLKNKKTRLGK